MFQAGDGRLRMRTCTFWAVKPDVLTGAAVRERERERERERRLVTTERSILKTALRVQLAINISSSVALASPPSFCSGSSFISALTSCAVAPSSEPVASW
ncbi:hypothetical protein EYF80_007536 [Liparis tanakae]|uniref:Uncharacterized protein n=1 Tax=Liparis tanakae TaxID=230148 RepID=A0A4Z2IXD7_9TELE|nr:hypothetical protein EYF80_007536 [Liparis tanakae]